MLRPTLPTVYRAPLLCVVLYLAFALAAALAAGQARGAEAGDTGTIPKNGLFLSARNDPDRVLPAPAVAGTADIDISGITGRVTIRQEFLNPADTWVEGVYVFPLPEDAAVDQMRLRVDDRLIDGVIAERKAARQIYDKAVQSGRRASLLEQERPNLFTMSVANIPPKGRVAVEIGYQQAVSFQDGRFSIRFPMAVTPRYIPAPTGPVGVRAAPDNGSTPPEDANRLGFPVRHPDSPPSNPVSIRVVLQPGLPLATLESRSHKLMVNEPSEGRYEVTLDAGAVPADRDFVLDWSLDPAKEPRPALFVETKDGAAYLMALIVPPVAAPSAVARRPREAIYVIDVSGSMHGESIRQARDSLLFALDRLQPVDRFNVIAFSDRTTRLFDASRPADAASLDAARGFVRALQANGGTEIGTALNAALYDEHQGKDRADSLRQVVLLTDGAVGNEPALLSRLTRAVGRSRLFTVAIGSAPNGHFMREAARIGRGAMMHIGDRAEVRRRMTELFAKLENPALTGMTASFPDPEKTESLPSPLPDLYVGEPVVLTARLPEAKGEFGLAGVIGSRDWSVKADLASAQAATGIAKLWARNKVDREMGRLRAGAAADEVRQSVLALALAHGLLTSFTSLVAVDQTVVRPDKEQLSQRQVPVNPPAGWTPPSGAPANMMQRTAASAVAVVPTPPPSPTVSLGARTATSAQVYALAGAILLLAALLVWVSHRRFRQ